MNRKDILEAAMSVITKDRQDQYGNAEDCFQTIASYWSVYLKKHISQEDVAMMMILLKVARTSANFAHLDNYIDICGYSALAGEMIPKEGVK